MKRKDREKKLRKENKKKIALFYEKVGFVSAVVVLFTLFNECLKLRKIMYGPIYFLEIVVSIIIYLLAICSEKFDKRLDSENVRKFSAFLSFTSIVVFIIQFFFNNLYPSSTLLDIMCIFLFGEMIIGALILLFEL